jgi:quinol monooxygenase YgiN
MQSQLELAVRTPAPAVSLREVEMLVDVLGGIGRWSTASDLATHLGAGYNDRKVRAIAAAAMPQIVSYPGSPGYKLFRDCTVEEINHCIEAFESQGRDMLKRALLYRQAYHRRFRGNEKDQPTRRTDAG